MSSGNMTLSRLSYGGFDPTCVALNFRTTEEQTKLPLRKPGIVSIPACHSAVSLVPFAEAGSFLRRANMCAVIVWIVVVITSLIYLRRIGSRTALEKDQVSCLSIGVRHTLQSSGIASPA